MLVSGTHGGEGERHVFWDVALSRNRRGVPELHLERLATQSGEYIVMEHNMPRSDVLVIGAGPTGLVLALWLTKLGVKLRIIDKTAEPGSTSPISLSRAVTRSRPSSSGSRANPGRAFLSPRSARI